MNARNLLIGIGIVAVVTGGVLGSGALTQVNAERTATVSTAGDSSAAIALTPDTGLDSYINGTSQTAEGLEIGFTNINENAVTTTSAFEVTNNLNEGVGIKITDDASWLAVDYTGNTSEYNDLGSGNSITVEVTIDTTDSSFASDTDVGITVEADTEQHGSA